ncbi:MAG: GPP34 family phosphoprotein [Candidatus Marinimicrobia bacterium]|nr:GPP34 family phosphoprotein [Candidatus Neomarinimicrobiota bacterium]
MENSAATFNTAEIFLILSLKPDKAGFLVPEHIRFPGLTGALLLDLCIAGNIAVDKKNLVPLSQENRLSSPYKEIFEQIAGRTKTRKVKRWVSKLSSQARRYQKSVLKGLEKKGSLVTEHKKFLFFSYYKTRLNDTGTREKLIAQIRNFVLAGDKPGNEMAAVLALIEACKLHKLICRDRREIRLFRPKMKEILKEDAISESVGKIISEMQAAIMGAVAATSVAGTASSK